MQMSYIAIYPTEFKAVNAFFLKPIGTRIVEENRSVADSNHNRPLFLSLVPNLSFMIAGSSQARRSFLSEEFWKLRIRTQIEERY